MCRFVEYETGSDLKTAVEKIDGQDFKGNTIRAIEDVSLPYRVYWRAC